MKNVLLILILLNAIILPFGIKLPQENPQELFLSDQSFKELSRLNKEFGNNELIFSSGLNESQLLDIMDESEKIGAEFSSLSPLLKGHGVLNLPPLSDVENFNFFKKLENKFPELSFAGEGYTSAMLAGMSMRIQQVLFPMVFALIFFGLLILTRSLSASAYLFFSSLLGVSLGLLVVRLFYGHSTILTTLTPLIGFILTLGVQLHVVYGLNLYLNVKTFFEHKMRPLLIMMVTTVIGFASLATSDLASIRQLAVTSTLCLLFTWGTLLAILKTISFKVNLNSPHLLRKNLVMPSYKPFMGPMILILLSIGGTVGLLRMPVLVEAIEFFPKDHRIHLGHENITKGLGGTPQFDIIINKNNSADLGFEDFQLIAKYEGILARNYPNLRFLSLNNLIKFANEQYSGIKGLPDNEFAYSALGSRIPSTIYSHHLSGSSYRLSVISPILNPNDRLNLQTQLEASFIHIDKKYNARISGLTHLLQESQSHLVKSLMISFLTSFIAIVAIFAFFSRDAYETFIFGTLNFASILGGIFVMWISGFTLNVSSIMTVSISMGLVVDSTVHLLYADKLKTSKEALFHATLLPIIFGHIILFFAFGILSFESFLPIRDFALGLILLLFTGLVCDLYVLPMISGEKKKEHM